MFEKYGFKNIFEDSQYIQKAFLEKHGVMSPMHDADILDKVLKSRYRWKPFVLPDGTTILLQGNEPWAMAALLEIYSQDAIAYDKKTIPVVYYQYESKRSRYFPDFYIPSKNLIIEVKSEYTYLSDLSRNQAKEAACLNQGYLFEFWVYDRKGNKVNHLTSKLV